MENQTNYSTRKEMLQNLYNLRKNEKAYYSQLEPEEKEFYDDLSREDKDFCLELFTTGSGKEIMGKLESKIQKLKINRQELELDKITKRISSSIQKLTDDLESMRYNFFFG